MPYGTIKVDTVTFTDNSADKNISLSGLVKNPTFTGNVTATGTISGDIIKGGTTISGTTVTGTIANFVSGLFSTQVSGTTVIASTGTFTSLTGTTTTGTTASFTTGAFTSLTGTTTTGTTASFTTGAFTSLTGTTTTGTTASFVSGLFSTRVSGTTVIASTGTFTSLTGTTTTGTTASFTTGAFTSLTGTTTTGTTANFTTGAFTSLTGTTATFTSGIIASGTAALPSLAILSDPNTGIYSPGADQVAISTNSTERVRIDSSGNVTLNAQGDLRFADADSSNWVALQAPTTIAANVTWTLPATDGTASQVLSTNGSGTLSWATVSGGGGGDVTLSGTQTLTNKTLTDPAIVGTILEDVYTITDGAAFEVDPGNGSIQLITLGASRTPKATNFAAGESITLMVNDGTAYTLTWTDATWGSGGVVWKGGSAPTLATSGYSVIQFWKVSTQVYGASVGDVA